MTADKELIELCAKALGWTIEENGEDINGHPWFWIPELGDNWNPLTDQSDSDRMACELEIDTRFSLGFVRCCAEKGKFDSGWKSHDNTTKGRHAAVREARVLVAAEMGRVKS